jgi:hemolysin activation/secretion protein
LRYSFGRQQTLSEQLTFNAAFSGQFASKNLDSGEKFYLGGSSGIRAYPGSEGGGSEGRMANLELRWRINDQFNLVGFYDWGMVTVNRDNNITGAATLNQFSLRGTGLSFAWQIENGPNLKAVWARRIGNNPNPTTTGNDQDGTLLHDRFWLTASLPF